MKLHAFDREFLVSEAHDFVFGGARADFQNGRERIGIDDQRMIAHRVERTREASEDRIAIVNHRRSLAMHQARSAHNLAAEHLSDALMAEAAAENRPSAPHLAQYLQRDPRLGRSARSRRDYDCARSECAHSGDVDCVVTLHSDIGAELAEILHEVVGKRIVVINHYESHYESNRFSVLCHRRYLFAAVSKSRAA